MKIVVLDGHTVVQDDLSWDGLKEFGELVYYERTEPGDVINRIHDAHMVITSKCVIDKNVIDTNQNLKYIGVIATGYNNIDIKYAKEKGIVVTNIPAYSTDSVAQFAFSLILEAANRVGDHNDSAHKGDWGKSPDFCYTVKPQMELAGKTIGIVGYGNIGKKVETIAKAFGMNVLAYSSHMIKASGDESVADEGEKLSTDYAGNTKFVTLERLLSESDIITLHCALTSDNNEMINKDSIKLMKSDAILVNTSRGPLINETDLAEALNSGKLFAAALDVLPKEPPVEKSPLMNLDNCIITPHIAWITKEARMRLIEIALENVRAFTNKNPKNEVV